MEAQQFEQVWEEVFANIEAPQGNSTDNSFGRKIEQIISHGTSQAVVEALRSCANPLPPKGQGLEPALMTKLVKKSGACLL